VSQDRSDPRPMGERTATVVVRFDQQQRKLLDFLRAEGTFGQEDGEIIRNVVLDFLKQREAQGRP
jgi:hypothetical protein